MGNDFYPGMVVGVILGVLVTMIGMAIAARIAISTPKPQEKERDPADWWKDGVKQEAEDEDEDDDDFLGYEKAS